MSQGVLCDHKTRRKLLLGQKCTQICFRVSMQDDCLKGEFQDLVILAEFIVCSKKISSPCNGFRLSNALHCYILTKTFFITTFDDIIQSDNW